MSTAFIAAERLVYGLEKGKYPGNLPSDPNRTMDGVTQTTYDRSRKKRNLPTRDVYLMEVEERLAIYREFWVSGYCDLLPPLSAAAHFHFHFNSGNGTLPLQRALQKSAYYLLSGVTVEADGKMGAQTRGAMSRVSWWDDEEFRDTLLFEQLRSYHSMCLKKKHLRPNLTSWVGRILAAWDM